MISSGGIAAAAGPGVTLGLRQLAGEHTSALHAASWLWGSSMRAINMQRKQGGGAGPEVSSSSWFDERCKQAEPVVACSCARLVVGSWEATRAEIACFMAMRPEVLGSLYNRCQCACQHSAQLERCLVASSWRNRSAWWIHYAGSACMHACLPAHRYHQLLACHCPADGPTLIVYPLDGNRLIRLFIHISLAALPVLGTEIASCLGLGGPRCC